MIVFLEITGLSGDTTVGSGTEAMQQDILLDDDMFLRDTSDTFVDMDMSGDVDQSLTLRSTATSYGSGYHIGSGSDESSGSNQGSENCKHHKYCQAGAVAPDYCHCDEVCHIYGDCCPDIRLKDNFTTSYTVKTAMHYSRCKVSTSSLGLIHMIDTCSEEYNNGSGIKRACEGTPGDDILLQVPVSESRFGIVFSNLYCAMCHGWSRDQITFWNVQMTCTHSQMEQFSVNNSVNEIVKESTCTKIFEAPQKIVSPRKCISVISSCQPVWQDHLMAEQCDQRATSLVWAETSVFKNKYCAFCNSHVLYDCFPTDPDKKTFPKVNITLDPLTGSHNHICDGTAYPFYFQSTCILLDFNNDSAQINDGFLKKEACPKYHVFDYISGVCRIITCRDGYQLIDRQTCERVEISTYGTVNMTSFPSNHTDTAINDTCTQYACIDTITNCPTVQLYIHYEILTNGSLLFTDTGIVLHDNEFIEENNSILICADMFDINPGLRDYDIQVLVTLVGQIISIVSLAILLLIYCTNRSLRNLPGICLMFLATCLLIAQLSFISGALVMEIYIVCYVLSVTTHYFFLSSFFWMNVMAYDVWKTFRTNFSANVTRSGRYKTLGLYACYALLSPALIVAWACTADNVKALQTYRLSPKYADKLCWINDKRTLIYYFGIPLFILLKINIALFSLSVANICKTVASTKIVRNTSKSVGRKKHLLLYVKLSTLMGLTWIFGFAASITNYEILWYLFIILNSLQGLFICIAFTCNRKVHTLVKTRLSCQRISSSRSSKTKSSLVAPSTPTTPGKGPPKISTYKTSMTKWTGDTSPEVTASNTATIRPILSNTLPNPKSTKKRSASIRSNTSVASSRSSISRITSDIGRVRTRSTSNMSTSSFKSHRIRPCKVVFVPTRSASHSNVFTPGTKSLKKKSSNKKSTDKTRPVQTYNYSNIRINIIG